MAINWIDVAVVFLFTLSVTTMETRKVLLREDIKDSLDMIFVLATFRFFYYAIPFYVADIAFVPFIVNTLGGHPFAYVQSISNDVLRFSIVFGSFGLAKIIYPRIVYMNSKYSVSSATYKSITDATFVHLLSKTMNQLFLLVVIYICILLTIFIPFFLYALFFQCSADSSCWPFSLKYLAPRFFLL